MRREDLFAAIGEVEESRLAMCEKVMNPSVIVYWEDPNMYGKRSVRKFWLIAAVVVLMLLLMGSAIAALVKVTPAVEPVNYSKLQDAIKSVEQFNASEELSDLFAQLTNAVNNGKALLNRGDQAAVDAAAARINKILEELNDALNALKKEPETVIKEVEVEVLPKDDYCNIEIHYVWPILFFVSLALNVVLAVAIITMVAKKKKNAKDDTPLVDYDIGDDA